jgi:tyrosyl-tRNA synthetase
MPDEIQCMTTVGGSAILIDAVSKAFVLSRSEARRQIEQGGVQIDGNVEKNAMASVNIGSVIQWGKRNFVRLVKE